MKELFRPELDIKNLTVEAPTAEFERPFDPERDVPEGAWTVIIKEVNRCREKENSSTNSLLHFATNLKLLSPTRFDALNWTNEELELFQALFRHLSFKLAPDSYVGLYLLDVYQQKILFPEKPLPDLDIRSEVLSPNNLYRIRDTGLICLLYPEKSEAIAEEVTETWQNGLSLLNEMNLNNYLITASRLRLFRRKLDPAIQISPEIWQAAKKEVLRSLYTDTEHHDYLQAERNLDYLTALRFIDAEYVYANETGIVFENGVNTPKTEEPSLPEQRRY